MSEGIRKPRAATGATRRERDDATGTETTGHTWDGIKELDTPMPRWWLWTFYATIVWALAYTIAYPAWPMIDRATKGVLGYSSRKELVETVAAHQAANAGTIDAIAEASFDEIAADPALNSYAFAGGAALFRTHCIQCHGAGGAGNPGYPNLVDDEWLWGGTHDEIYVTLQNGIRWEDNPDTRWSEMPAFGATDILTAEQVEAVADYVLALPDAPGMDHAGAQIYADNCAACHGENGTGLHEVGAPNLVDPIWLYRGDRESIIRQVTQPRHGVMPAWSRRLSDAELKQLTHYVHSLGGDD